jgi:HNH endonuclease
VEGRVIPEPYKYANSPHVRRHGPTGWKDYHRYRDWLRDEFSFRCVYCLEREVWRDMRESMHIEHFQPQAIRKDLKSEYTNLLYACPACNSQKADTILPDPCEIALAECLQIHEDGRVEATNNNPKGQMLIDELALDDPRTISRRRIIIGTLRSLANSDWSMFREWMRFPKNLPDLNGKENKPPANTKPESAEQSYFEKERRGELPEVY